MKFWDWLFIKVYEIRERSWHKRHRKLPNPIYPGVAAALALRLVSHSYVGTNRRFTSGILAVPFLSLVFTGVFFLMEFGRRQMLEDVMNQEEFHEIFLRRFGYNLLKPGIEKKYDHIKRYIINDSVNE